MDNCGGLRRRAHAVGMVRRPAELPAALPWPVFSRAEALRAGVPADRLRRPDLRRLRRGLYARRDAPLEEVHIAGALCRHDPDLVIVGLSAARLLKIPLTRHLESWSPEIPVEVASLRARGRSDGVIRWHELCLTSADIDSGRYHHIPSGLTSAMPMTTRARTWRDLAVHLSLSALIAAGDHLLRIPRPGLEGRKQPWCTRAELRDAATGRHAAVLRAALDRMRVGADSPTETTLRLAFLDAGLPEPQINVPIRDPLNEAGHSPDFQWPQFRLCAEYEGTGHNDPQQVARDIRRARAVKSAGFTEIRLYRDDLRQGCAPAIRILREELRARGWRPGTSAGGERS